MPLRILQLWSEVKRLTRDFQSAAAVLTIWLSNSSLLGGHPSEFLMLLLPSLVSPHLTPPCALCCCCLARIESTGHCVPEPHTLSHRAILITGQ